MNNVLQNLLLVYNFVDAPSFDNSLFAKSALNHKTINTDRFLEINFNFLFLTLGLFRCTIWRAAGATQIQELHRFGFWLSILFSIVSCSHHRCYIIAIRWAKFLISNRVILHVNVQSYGNIVASCLMISTVFQ